MIDFDTAHAAACNFSLLSREKLRGIWNLACELTAPGDMAELGVGRGGVARLMSLARPERLIHLFDTFTGIPWDGYDQQIDRHRPGEFAAPLDEVRRVLSECPGVRFHPGLFPGTAVDGVFSLVHLDADTHAATKAGLEWFWPRLSKGGAIVLDDYRWHHCPGVEKAVDAYFAGTDARFVTTVEYQLTVVKR